MYVTWSLVNLARFLKVFQLYSNSWLWARQISSRIIPIIQNYMGSGGITTLTNLSLFAWFAVIIDGEVVDINVKHFIFLLLDSKYQLNVSEFTRHLPVAPHHFAYTHTVNCLIHNLIIISTIVWPVERESVYELKLAKLVTWIWQLDYMEQIVSHWESFDSLLLPDDQLKIHTFQLWRNFPYFLSLL